MLTRQNHRHPTTEMKISAIAIGLLWMQTLKSLGPFRATSDSEVPPIRKHLCVPCTSSYVNA